MSKEYRLFVFDWEGTISDTLGQIIHCVDREAKRLNFGDFDVNLARQSVELGLVNAMRKIYPNLSSAQHQELLAAVQQNLYARNAEVYLMPGVKEFIEALAHQGFLLAIASNKSQQGLVRALQVTGLDPFFKVFRTASTTAAKPCPQMLSEILDEYAVPPEMTLMIGDSATDIEMAKSINVDAVGVDFYHQQAELLLRVGAMAVFDGYRQLAQFLGLPDKE